MSNVVKCDYASLAPGPQCFVLCQKGTDQNPAFTFTSISFLLITTYRSSLQLCPFGTGNNPLRIRTNLIKTYYHIHNIILAQCGTYTPVAPSSQNDLNFNDPLAFLLVPP